VIAQEELAKIIMLPLAKELDELSDLVNNRSSGFYDHRIKQKLFASYGMQKPNHQDIEQLKQSCLYVGVSEDGEPRFTKIQPEEARKEVLKTKGTSLSA
jgi:hypothetical protein